MSDSGFKARNGLVMSDISNTTKPCPILINPFHAKLLYIRLAWKGLINNRDNFKGTFSYLQLDNNKTNLSLLIIKVINIWTRTRLTMVITSQRLLLTKEHWKAGRHEIRGYRPPQPERVRVTFLVFVGHEQSCLDINSIACNVCKL